MGTWGAGLEDSDFFFDVQGRFRELLNTGMSAQESTDAVMQVFLGVSWDEIMDESNLRSD